MLRLNMAHASHQWVEEVTSCVREVAAEVRRDVSVMMDIKGPEIRTGLVSQPIELHAGDFLELTTCESPPASADIPRVSVNYAELPSDVQVGGVMLVDSGLIQLRVIEKSATCIRTEVLTPGTLGSRRHINLPGVHVRLPALTAKDECDLQVGVKCGIDFVALSFVRDAEAVRSLRRLLDALGSNAQIIAKIEDQAGVRNAQEIMQVADAMMVARGDLGIEIEYHKLPLVQTELVRICQAEGKPVIIATQLLESMIQSPMPTRAEISDVCNAVREQVDAVMMSGETATGAYPLKAIAVLKNIIESTEPSIDRELNSKLKLIEPKAKMLRSAAVLAQELGNSGIVVFTRSGYLAATLGALRARDVPIYAFTDIESTYRQSMLPWGVEPFKMQFNDDPEITIVNALERLQHSGWCLPGSWLVVITNALASETVIDTLQLRQVQ